MFPATYAYGTLSPAMYGVVPGLAAAGSVSPFPVRHPLWLTYGPRRKISIIDGAIARLQVKQRKKRTAKRAGRIQQLTSLRRAIKQRMRAKRERKDTSALDAQILELSTPFTDDSDVGLAPDAVMAPAVPESSRGGATGPLLALGLGAVVLLGAIAYKRRKK